MRVRIAGPEARERFNAFVAASPLADTLQAYEWGEVKRPSGWQPVRLMVTDGERLAATCSLLVTRPARGVAPIAYAPRGPILDYTDRAALEAVVEGARRHAGGAFALICDPAVGTGGPEEAALRSAGLRPVTMAGFGGVQPRAVMILDLARPLDEIFGAFKSKWRYNVRLAERRGVTIREAGQEDLPALYELLTETARRDGFLIRGRSYYETLWEHLAPANMLQIFLAEYQGRLIAGIMLFLMGSRAVYTYGASSNEHRTVMPNHLVQWHAIRWCHERGYRIYDFRGVSPLRNGEPVEPAIAGLNRFKEGFGARYVEYAGQFERPLRRGWYLLWRTAAPAAMALRRRLRGGAGAPED